MTFGMMPIRCCRSINLEPEVSASRTTARIDLGWSKRLLAVSSLSILGLLFVCVAGGYTLYQQSKSTQETLRISQKRADAAIKAQTAILTLGKEEAQLVNATEQVEQRTDAVLAIQASSILDESIQRLQNALAGNPKVVELAHALDEIGPMKLAIIRAARNNDREGAKLQLQNMQSAMWRIEQISGELVDEENARLLAAIVSQSKQASSTLRILASVAIVCLLLTGFAARGLIVRTTQLDRARRESDVFINCVPSILIGSDSLGHINRWNKSAVVVFGKSFSEVVGKPIYECGIAWIDRDLKNELHAWANLDSAKRLDDFMFKKGEEVRVLGLTVNPVRFGGGRAHDFLITGADITERRTMERELRQAQKLEAIGQLSAGIAHEINTPVQYARDNVTFVKQSWESVKEILSLSRLITMEAGALELRPQSIDDFEAKCAEIDLDFLLKDIPSALDQSFEGLERVANIVRAMKEFSHPGSTEKVPLNINRAIESTIAVARNEWKYVADVTTEFDESLPPVLCFAGEFNQVILNLLVNAAHAVSDVVQQEPQNKGKIAFKTWHDESWVEVQIQDTGKGIPEEISNKVFEPFFTTKEVGKGTGQGLALAHSVIVKKHAGKIWFESTVGKGTTFHIRLPMVERSSVPAIAATAN